MSDVHHLSRYGVCLSTSVSDCLAICLTALLSQFTAVGPAGPVGPSALAHASLVCRKSTSPPGHAVVPALTPPPPMIPRQQATGALEMRSRSKAAASSPTVQVGRQRAGTSGLTINDLMGMVLQWTAAGGCGLLPGSAPPPVGRGFSCPSGCVTNPPRSTADRCVPA